MLARNRQVHRKTSTLMILTALVSCGLCCPVVAEQAEVRLPSSVGQAMAPQLNVWSHELPSDVELPPRSPGADVAQVSYEAPMDYFPREAVREEVRSLVWTKGDFKIVPYAVLWSDMIYATSRTFPGRFVLWIQSDELQGEEAFQLDARYSRVGLDVEGPTIDLFGGITSGGKVEIDFLGNFVTENQPDLRLRHAYWEAKNDRLRILVGQYWDLISPRLPNTVVFSVGWGVGNIGFRRAQFRMERYHQLSDRLTWSVQGALAQNVIPDFSSGSASAGVTRETGGWPMIQARTALKRTNECRPASELGFSAHIGETGFDFAGGHPANPNLGPDDDVRFQSWSFNVDATLPVTQRLGFQGEFFMGANLSNELGGIVQGICPCLRVPIRAIGGWGEIAYHWTPQVRTHVGFGIDDPNNADLLLGRSYNRFVYANLFLDLTKHLTTALGVSSWRTNYLNRTNEPGFTPVDGPTTPGEAVVIDWSVRFTF